jgi:twinkle protein
MFLDNHFRIVHRTYGSTGHNLGWLEEMVYTLAVRDQCKLIIIDPWNELEHLPEPGESLTNYINFALQRIRQWAEKLDVHIEVIAHPKKMNNDFAHSRPPFGYDVADSAAFANKPAIGWTIHKADDEHDDTAMELWNWKVRDAEFTKASKGVTRMHYDKVLMSYTPEARE